MFILASNLVLAESIPCIILSPAKLGASQKLDQFNRRHSDHLCRPSENVGMGNEADEATRKKFKPFPTSSIIHTKHSASSIKHSGVGNG